jgi:hypothetical protein
MNTRELKELYKRELGALSESGRYIAPYVTPVNGEYPDPASESAEDGNECDRAFWELACRRLREARSDGDAAYREPTAWKDIETEQSRIPPLRPLETDDEYKERLSGAVFGKIVGVILGKPFENGMSREDVRRYLESVGEYPLRDYASGFSPALGEGLREDCIPSTKGHVAFAQPDDDLNYLVLALRLAENHGLSFTSYDVGRNYAVNIPAYWVWASSRKGYYDFLSITNLSETRRPGDCQLAVIPWTIGGDAECLDGQIKSDFWGYIHPGDPRKAAKYAYRDCAFSLVKNGVYGGMFTAGCIAAAMTKEPKVDTILDGGLAVIPPGSRLYEAVERTREEYARDRDFLRVFRMIEEKYGHYGFAGTVNNLATVTLCLLCGDLDYTDTVTLAVSCGGDTDCNGGTAGSICGAAVGRRGIEDRFIDPLNDTLRTCVADVGQIRISELIGRIAAVSRRVNGTVGTQ